MNPEHEQWVTDVRLKLKTAREAYKVAEKERNELLLRMSYYYTLKTLAKAFGMTIANINKALQ